MEKLTKGRTEGQTGGWVYVNKNYLVSLSYKNNRRKGNLQTRIEFKKIFSRHKRSHSEILRIPYTEVTQR